jgi:hypothetical protein
LEAFARGLSCVLVEDAHLAASPKAALLASHAAEQALRDVTADLEGTSTAAYAGGSASSTCPPSPARDSDAPCVATVGVKRRAEAPAALMTPVVKPRLVAMLTPYCSADATAQ